MNDRENLQYCTEKFVTLANELKDEGLDIQLVNAALMSACGIYTTYALAGNEGALESSGVDKVVERFRLNLEHIQKQKKEELQGGHA